MPAPPAPAPPPLQRPKTSVTSASAEAVPIFTFTGETPDNTFYDFPDTGFTGNGVPLRFLMRQWAAGVKMIPARTIYNVLGRLRCLRHTIAQFNSGLADNVRTAH